MSSISGKLKTALTPFTATYPGESGRRQPVHTVYGGAHLFKADSAGRLGSLAVRSFETYAPDAPTFAAVLGIPVALADTIYERVREKIGREAVEDFRIDFEDGYGTRPDAEEDGHTAAAAQEVAKGFADGTLPPFIGIRIKTFSEELHARAIRTLDIFLTTLTRGPAAGCRTILSSPCRRSSRLSRSGAGGYFRRDGTEIGPRAGSLKMEMMIETTQSIIAPDGEINTPRLLEAARGRCTAAHFGTYDYTASCSITAAYQDMLHPACDFARSMMQVSFGGTGVWLSDGATNIMPVAPHRGDITPEQEAENRVVVHRAWRLHYDHIRHSLANAFYQGWDLHPGQLPTRYAAVYTFFLEGLDAASERLRNFVAKAAQATLVGDVFDDAATGQGLLNYFLRAINCGAITEEEAVERTTITLDELRSGSFVKILKNRQN